MIDLNGPNRERATIAREFTLNQPTAQVIAASKCEYAPNFLVAELWGERIRAHISRRGQVDHAARPRWKADR